MYYIGVDLGGTNISVGILNSDYDIIAKERIKTNVPRKESEICDDIADLIFVTLGKLNISIEDVKNIGIGSPGAVNIEKGVVEYSPNLYFHNWDLKNMMADRIRKQIFIENDANAAAYGEYIAGNAGGVGSAIIITIGTGIGGGAILNGKIYHGFNYNGAELGHMVIYQNGRECTCGRRGCFEQYASAKGLVNTTKLVLAECKEETLIWDLIENKIENISPRTAFKAMRLGDELGKKIVDMYISDLSCGIINIINIFQPEILCIGGGVSNEGDYLIKPLMEDISKYRYSKNASRQTEIKVAKLGNDAGIIGAAFLHRLY